MRPFYAWLLLTAICLQWIGGSYCLKVGYTIEIERNMNQTEVQIAESVKAQLGVEAQVRQLSADDIALQAKAYSSFFAFSEEVDGETVYYTLEKDAVDVVDASYQLGQPLDSRQLTPQTNWERLFAQFRCMIITPPTLTDWPEWPSRSYANASWRCRYAPAQLTPPPELFT